MKSKYDILIPVAAKDYNKLRFVCESIVKNIQGYNKIYIISPTAISDFDMYLDAVYLNDRDVIDFDFTRINMPGRRGWYRQQFIKLFQQVTLDNYLVVDSDIWIDSKLEVDPSNPVFYLGKDQCHDPYFRLTADLFGLVKRFDHSFISEIMLFNRRLICTFLSSHNIDEYQFFDLVADKINEMNDNSGFSEYEFYGTYIFTKHRDRYGFKKLNVKHTAKKSVWSVKEMEDHIRKYSGNGYDILTMHSWI